MGGMAVTPLRTAGLTKVRACSVPGIDHQLAVKLTQKPSFAAIIATRISTMWQFHGVPTNGSFIFISHHQSLIKNSASDLPWNMEVINTDLTSMTYTDNSIYKAVSFDGFHGVPTSDHYFCECLGRGAMHHDHRRGTCEAILEEHADDRHPEFSHG